ncbi:MAG: methionine gamma-lyase family protein [Clostridia bacterium]|nr:methionine gamma-lyase family protein [Clostridia bacterium]
MILLNNKAQQFVETNEQLCLERFKQIDQIELTNQLKVLNAFNKAGLAERHFIGSFGYGHGDIGKEITNEIFATIFNTESAIASPMLTCGTATISHTLLGLLRPNDLMLCVSGTPYDTLKDVLFGVEGEDNGSLKDLGIKYDQIDLINNDFNYDEIIKYLTLHNVKMLYVQRSRGYEWRNAINIAQMEKLFKLVRNTSPNTIIVVDNCYGEFVETKEPTDVGADIAMGSMIKNIGGGIAPTGGYVVGNTKLINMIACHLFSPALGIDSGSYSEGYKLILQGLFVAPHIVSQAKKVAVLTSQCLNSLGYQTIPSKDDVMSDIVCSIKFGEPNTLIKFCRCIQNASPVDGNTLLEPSDMAGYEDKIIMASGSFNQGSSIELSCDAPIRKPFIGYLQGSLSYAHGKIALTYALQRTFEEMLYNLT